MTSFVLSYFRSYFDPEATAPHASHSAGLIARNLYGVLGELGSVRYVDASERPAGLEADVLIGHLWAFEAQRRRGRFGRAIAFYSVSDPEVTRRQLSRLAERFEVPMPTWDLPPPPFCHATTMEAADRVLLVGNRHTLETFPRRWRSKIRLINYAVDGGEDHGPPPERRPDFCYAASDCDLRKGFMDVLRTWSGLPPETARLHVVGRLRPPWTELLDRYDPGSIVYHGWLDSSTDAYWRLLRSCRYAYLPTYSEGQMGTLLEAVAAGCVPITTRASGADERVLDLCELVEPLDVVGQRRAIETLRAWSEAEYRRRRRALQAAAAERQSWRVFRAGVRAAVEEVLPVAHA